MAEKSVLSDYSKHSVQALWNSLANENSTQIDQVVQGWRNTATTLDIYASFLQNQIDALFAAWQPSPGSAAENFKTQMDYFKDIISTAAGSASANYTALGIVVEAVLAAKGSIQTVHSNMTAAGLDPSKMPDSNNTTDQYATYYQTARLAMSKLDATVNDVVDSFEIPQPTMPFGKTAGEIQSTSRDTSSAGGAAGIVSYTGQSTLSIMDITAPVALGSPAATGNWPATSTGSANLAGSTATVLPGASGTPSSGSSVWSGGQTGSYGASGGPRVMQYGTVIGQEPPTPTGRTSATGSSSSAPSRKSGTASERTATGKSGTNAASKGTTAAERSGQNGTGRTGGMGSGQTGARRRKRDENGQPIWDRDNPWEIDYGVPPVLEAPPEPTRHDPGPGVIGIDR